MVIVKIKIDGNKDAYVVETPNNKCYFIMDDIYDGNFYLYQIENILSFSERISNATIISKEDTIGMTEFYSVLDRYIQSKRGQKKYKLCKEESKTFKCMKDKKILSTINLSDKKTFLDIESMNYENLKKYNNCYKKNKQ